MPKRIFFLLIFVAGNIFSSAAQQDTKEEPKDSVSIYQNLYKLSKQYDFSKVLYELIFKKPENGGNTAKTTQNTIKYNQKAFQGKIIRDIIIINQSPFEVTQDSIKFFTEENLNRVGNHLHVKTWPFVIRDLLLFKKHDAFDLLTVQESERLIRSQRYVESTSILPVAIPGNDSIDIVVSVKDIFSIYPEGQLSASKFGLGLKEINFLGLGHQAHAFGAWNFDGGLANYQYDYSIPNISNTYISTQLLYKKNNNDSTDLKQVLVNRPFYSSLARWAGGITIAQQSENEVISFPDLLAPVSQFLKYNIQDYWGAFALKVRNRDAERINTQNIIFSGRYYQINYMEYPLPEYDPDNLYTEENLYLLGIGFSDRRYKKDRYLFKYGFIEDVPIGQSYELIGGIQHKNSGNRLYLAAKLSKGGFLKFGYLSGELEYGSFFKNSGVEEGVFTAQLNYFSPLLEIGGWKFRQFIKPQLMFGINRLETDRLYLNDYFGLKGFDSDYITGTRKFVCNFQTQVFSPWDIWGFKLAPYLLYSFGMLGDDQYGFSQSKVYSMFGLGLLIRNDHLIFNTFQISISYYPYIPGSGYNVFKLNSYQASDFGLMDFDIQKPDKIIYQ